MSMQARSEFFPYGTSHEPALDESGTLVPGWCQFVVDLGNALELVRSAFAHEWIFLQTR
jgi:hypothetical protein